MHRNTPWQSYRQVSTQTASPGQIILMLFDGAIRHLDRALHAFGYDDPLELNETVNSNIQRAQAILTELNQSLDLERGGELASVLRNLYDYLDRRLQESNVRKAPEGVEEARQRITTLREAWHEMLTQRNPAAAEPGSAASGGLCVCG